MITDVLPAGLTYNAGSASNGGQYDATSNTLTWNIGLLPNAADGPIQVSFAATVATGTAGGTVLANSATLNCTGATMTSNTVNVTVIARGAPGDWWMYGHDPQHTGRSPFVAPSAPTQHWATTGRMHAAVLGADGTIYAGTTFGLLEAFNPDGSVKWSIAPRGMAILHLPGGRGGRHHLCRRRGRLPVCHQSGRHAAMGLCYRRVCRVLPGARRGRHHLLRLE